MRQSIRAYVPKSLSMEQIVMEILLPQRSRKLWRRISRESRSCWRWIEHSFHHFQRRMHPLGGRKEWICKEIVRAIVDCLMVTYTIRTAIVSLHLSNRDQLNLCYSVFFSAPSREEGGPFTDFSDHSRHPSHKAKSHLYFVPPDDFFLLSI